MLSILIPTYNYNCLSLVEELHQQGQKLGISVEIIVADDNSKEENKQENRKMNLLPKCRYIELDQNIGIARIRNFLADQAHYPYILFLDSDTMPVTKDFLARYIEAGKSADVVCGGLKIRRKKPDKKHTLRYYYGIKTEEKNSDERKKNPYGQFISSSFLINRQIFQQIRFNENFTQYGHEDTLFGKQLQTLNISLLHINNPIYHENKDTNDEFLEKTHKSLENSLRHKDILIKHVRILNLYLKLKKTGLHFLLQAGFHISKNLMLKNLTGEHPNLKIFALYKLGYLSIIDKKQHKF